MPSVEELLRDDAERWRDSLREAPALSTAVRSAVALASRSRHHSHNKLVLSAIASVAAVVAVALTISSLGRASSGPSSGASVPVSSPTETHAVTKSMFNVTSPLLDTPHGPAALRQSRCTPNEIVASAELHRSTYGVVGVVKMHGQNCSIPMYPGPSAFVDAAGRRLDIPVAPDSTLTGANIRPDLAFAFGNAAWGFAWAGSWCGPTPAAVILPLTGNPHAPASAEPFLAAPISGPVLACGGTSESTLVRGTPGRIGDAVLPAPAAWSSLTATLHVPSRPPDATHASVTLINNSNQDVALDPCPRFTLAVRAQDERGLSISSNTGLIPCDVSSTVPAQGELVLDLPALAGLADQHGTISTTIQFAIAGVATATLSLP